MKQVILEYMKTLLCWNRWILYASELVIKRAQNTKTMVIINHIIFL